MSAWEDVGRQLTRLYFSFYNNFSSYGGKESLAFKVRLNQGKRQRLKCIPLYVSHFGPLIFFCKILYFVWFVMLTCCVYPWQQNLAAAHPLGCSSMVTKMLIHSVSAGPATRTPDNSMVSCWVFLWVTLSHRIWKVLIVVSGNIVILLCEPGKAI